VVVSHAWLVALSAWCEAVPLTVQSVLTHATRSIVGVATMAGIQVQLKVIGARNIKNVVTFGKQSPYVASAAMPVLPAVLLAHCTLLHRV